MYQLYLKNISTLTSIASVLAFIVVNYLYVLIPVLAFLISAFGWLGGIPFFAQQGWDPLGNYVLTSSFGEWALNA